MSGAATDPTVAAAKVGVVAVGPYSWVLITVLRRMTPTDQKSLLPPPRLFWLGILPLWTLWGLWSAQQNVLVTVLSGRPVPSLVRPFGIALSAAWFWALLTPLLMWVTRRFRQRIPALSTRIAAHLGAFAVVHALDVVVYYVITNIADTAWRPFPALFFSLVTFNALTYIVVVFVTTALDYQTALRERALRAAQLETQLAQAQYQYLRAQLHPHFLFNSLNAIAALMHNDVQRADRMLTRLSELLRHAVETAATTEVKLSDEVEFARRYLDLERMRFGDRLNVRVELPAEIRDALVPNMLLQPLVENAVRHGIAPHAGPGRVEIRAARSGSRLEIAVRDSGTGIDANGVSNGNGREGVGLRATRTRLETLYGPAQEIVLMNVPGGGFETRVHLPFRLADGDAA